MVRKDKATTSQTSAFYVAQGPSVDLACIPCACESLLFPCTFIHLWEENLSCQLYAACSLSLMFLKLSVPVVVRSGA